MPSDPRLFHARVVRTEALSPSFQRVTIAGPDLAEFEWLGRDHWFRLFLPPQPGAALRLPTVKGRAWYRSYLLIPSGERPHCSNYTVAGFRPAADGGELDIDVVLHWHDGQLGGAVAKWAVGAAAGSPVGFLDQGVIFDPPEDAAEIYLACDETGLPAVRGILRDLPEDAVGRAFLEVPSEEDAGSIAAPQGVRVEWLVRNGSGRPAGQFALAELQQVAPHPDGYAFVVGESSLATGGRKALKKAGLAASRISFTGYWRA
ncbi:siderophore-interacting protein [Propionicimonas sp.]|uniref:siderophore-interacting protein n=1 Tax=Propionicimonas sp. TaxID=1955623 RepID=UPI0039E35350